MVSFKWGGPEDRDSRYVSGDEIYTVRLPRSIYPIVFGLALIGALVLANYPWLQGLIGYMKGGW